MADAKGSTTPSSPALHPQTNVFAFETKNKKTKQNWNDWKLRETKADVIYLSVISGMLLLLLLLMVVVMLLLLMMMKIVRWVRIVRIGPNVHVTATSVPHTDDCRTGWADRSSPRCHGHAIVDSANQIHRLAAVLSLVAATQTEPVMGLLHTHKHKKTKQKIQFKIQISCLFFKIKSKANRPQSGNSPKA